VPPESHRVLERVFRSEAGRLTASLVRLLGDFDLAEELVADAVVEGLERWPIDGVPERPAAWLLTTARRKALDRLRRDARYHAKLEALARLPAHPQREPDERLRLIFTCCHPALGREAQIALTLRAVVGLTTAEIARAFLVPEATIAKRIVRAKRKIADGGLPYHIPEADELRTRLDEALTVIYLVFNEGFLATGGGQAVRRDLARDAEWLAELLLRLLPNEPEALGLLALIRLHLARWPTRIDPHGRLVLLADQDRSRWDRRAISEARRLIGRVARLGPPGRFQLEAAIAAAHAEARSWSETDWRTIEALYGLLARVDPSPVVALNRAIALRYLDGPAAALSATDGLAVPLGSYHLFHATRAAFLREVGRGAEAQTEDGIAMGLTQNVAEIALLSDRVRSAG
jgi:RNA polymerase sigma-70 factor (ECF subfamily)